jgi:hypothetical protein
MRTHDGKIERSVIALFKLVMVREGQAQFSLDVKLLEVNFILENQGREIDVGSTEESVDITTKREFVAMDTHDGQNHSFVNACPRTMLVKRMH